MQFYEVKWVDHFNVEKTTIIPYSEIIAFKIFKYESIEEIIYTPVIRTGNYEFLGKKGKEGENEFLNWKKYIEDASK